MEIIYLEEESLSNSAKPSEIVVIPNSQVRRLSAAHIIKDELVLVVPKTSVSCKYSIAIKVNE
jgi:hypothetical protein